jgi:iron(III) transport system substrate-binding protein
MSHKAPLFLVAAALACSATTSRSAAQASLATDLPAAFVDTALQVIERAGGPHAERSPASASSADVFWDAEPYAAIAAANRGELAPMPETASDVPGLFRDPTGAWVAVGGRAQVLLVATQALRGRAAPSRLSSLTDPYWKGKVACVAPTQGPALAHFAALFLAWGEARTESWLQGLGLNDAQLLPDDAAVRNAVIAGRASVGIVSSDEAAKAAASAAKIEVIYPDQRSIGTFVWPTALAMPKNAPHPEAARKLIERLASRDLEQLLVARAPGFLPLRHGIPVPPGVRSAANLVVVSANPASIVAEIARRKERLAAWTLAMERK